jgi:hypothetical protein
MPKKARPIPRAASSARNEINLPLKVSGEPLDRHLALLLLALLPPWSKPAISNRPASRKEIVHGRTVIFAAAALPHREARRGR